MESERVTYRANINICQQVMGFPPPMAVAHQIVRLILVSPGSADLAFRSNPRGLLPLRF